MSFFCLYYGTEGVYQKEIIDYAFSRAFMLVSLNLY